MKFLISILAHEKPEIVIDQIENIHRWVPDAWIILHLHRKFAWGPPRKRWERDTAERVDFSKYDRVMVNPTSYPTEWGNLHHAHNANFHYAKTQMDFDYFLLHSSSDLFVKKGVEDYIKKFDFGVSILPPQHDWGAPHMAEADPVFQNIMRDAGAKELWTSQIEGTFYKTEVFAQMLEIIERYHRYDPSKPYIHEELYYPTIAATLTGNRGSPFLIREDNTHLPKFEPALVDQVRAGTLPDHWHTRWRLGREVTSQVWEGKNLYAMRPIPRVLDHPLRVYIRNLSDGT